MDDEEEGKVYRETEEREGEKGRRGQAVKEEQQRGMKRRRCILKRNRGKRKKIREKRTGRKRKAAYTNEEEREH